MFTIEWKARHWKAVESGSDCQSLIQCSLNDSLNGQSIASSLRTAKHLFYIQY